MTFNKLSHRYATATQTRTPIGNSDCGTSIRFYRVHARRMHFTLTQDEGLTQAKPICEGTTSMAYPVRALGRLKVSREKCVILSFLSLSLSRVSYDGIEVSYGFSSILVRQVHIFRKTIFD